MLKIAADAELVQLGTKNLELLYSATKYRSTVPNRKGPKANGPSSSASASRRKPGRSGRSWPTSGSSTFRTGTCPATATTGRRPSGRTCPSSTGTRSGRSGTSTWTARCRNGRKSSGLSTKRPSIRKCSRDRKIFSFLTGEANSYNLR